MNIAGCFAVQGFRIYDSQNGLFVKEPQRAYVKDGTEMSTSIFFPITKEAREALYGQILHSYELVMEKQQARQGETEDWLLEDDLPFDTADQRPPLPTDEDAPVMSM